MKPLLIALCLFMAAAVHGADTLSMLVGVLGGSSDPQRQLDILRGMRDATRGTRRLPMPTGWDSVERQLGSSDNAEIRRLNRSLGLTFGSQAALEALRAALKDRSLDAAQREDALRDLVGIRDAGIAETLQQLLSEPAMRAAAINALAAFDHPATGPALIAVYPDLSGTERRLALNTLAARAASARQLLGSIESGVILARDLTAEVIRQLRSLKDQEVDAALTKVYGTFRELSPDKQQEIERYRRLYRAGGSTPGDAIRGRAVFAKVCQQCHSLFDVGGRIGPDLTGSNRGDLEYILQNILDPNAVIPNEYLASTVDLKDGRVLTGIIKEQDANSLSIATATETVRVARTEIEDLSQSQLSMMPDGLLAALADQECRDLIYYLGRSGQAPMLATPDTVSLFFNERDLTLWQGPVEAWRVAEGEIVGQVLAGMSGSAVLQSEMIAGDFRLTFLMKLASANATVGVFFRAEPSADHQVRGYRIGLGAGTPLRLQDEGGRGLLGSQAQGSKEEPQAWTSHEILAHGSRIRLSIDGQPWLNLDDPAGSRQGIVAFQVQGADGAEMRIKNLRLELIP